MDRKALWCFTWGALILFALVAAVSCATLLGGSSSLLNFVYFG